jgi:dihydroorotate dehydrogenase (NAD+) catalytic subunit
MTDLRVTLGPLTLANPVLAAAGTFGYGLEFAQAVPLERLGGLITKTLTREPRQGHPPPRLVETPAGMLNAVGLQNVGLAAFLREKLPALRRYRVPVIVSILGEEEAEAGGMVRDLDRADGVAGIELNLSCPNVRKLEAGSGKLGHASSSLQPPASSFRLPAAQDPEATAAMVAAARSQTRKALIAKLSPEVADIVPIAQAAERAGADALTVGNTFTGMSLDPATRRSRLGVMTGGLSGPAIRPLAVCRVWYTAQSVRVPVIGLGGIVRADDALEFILAGASAVAVGTANFANPRAALGVLRGIERYLHTHRMHSLEDLRGAILGP